MKKDQYASIIDVRTPGEFTIKHVPGAINFPLDQLARRIDDLRELPEPILAYCQSGNRSGIAVSILKQHGFVNVVNGGGIEDVLTTIKFKRA